MDYLNPTSIANMFQSQKDTSIPGAGYGLSQGFLDAQAANQALDFLGMAKAKSAQDFVKGQFDLQSAYEDRPFNLRKREAELSGTQATNRSTELENQKREELIKQLQRGNQWEGVRTFGSATDAFARAKNPLERKMIWDAYVRRHEMLGLPKDELIMWDGSEQGWNDIVSQSKLARDLSSYSDQIAAQRAMTTEKEAGDTGRVEKTLTSQERRASAENATALEVARIRAAASRATESGGNAWSQQKADISQQYLEAITKRTSGQPLTPREQAILQVAPTILAPGYSTEVLRGDTTEQRAKAKSKGEIQGAMEALRKPADVSNEQDLQNRLRRYQ